MLKCLICSLNYVCLTRKVIFHHVEYIYIYHNRYKLLNQDNILVCPIFQIEPTQMGGNQSIVTDL